MSRRLFAKCRNLTENMLRWSTDLGEANRIIERLATDFAGKGLINEAQAMELNRLASTLELHGIGGGDFKLQLAQELYDRRDSFFPEGDIDKLLRATGGQRADFDHYYL